jgi:parvulin-like peptidyl-prolyl isomerase
VETAKKSSISPDADQGGDLGMVPRGQMPKELDEVIFKLKENEISEVIQSPYGFHVIKVTTVDKTGVVRYEDAKTKIHARIFQERLEKKYAEWMNKKRKEADVTIYADKLYNL